MGANRCGGRDEQAHMVQASDWAAHPMAPLAGRLLTEGGDARIRLVPGTGRNLYMSSPVPVGVLAYASSTANDISADAFAHVCDRLADFAPHGTMTPAAYAAALDDLRNRIRRAYGVAGDTAVLFAASGTDLEYLGLALAQGRAPGGVTNILLGADEVGSGCIHSAKGEYFADETARGVAVAKGLPLPGMAAGSVDLVPIPVRDPAGRAFTSAEMTAAIDAAVERARTEGRHSIVHVVHGSKTGLVLPVLADIDALAARHGDALTFLVDACQARITSAAIADYLARGATVMLTGSKFMGGPPFNGFALTPAAAVARAAPVPDGLGTVFRRAEWPAGWAGAEALPHEANPGLLLRYEASVFELERFQRLPIERVERVVLAFHAAVRAAFVERLGGRRIAPYPPGERAEGDAHPVEMRTLSTIDLTPLPGAPDFDAAVALHKALVERDIRLGQPVKCVRLPDGRWGATLRVGISMPQVVTFDALDDAALAERLAADMARIADALEAEIAALA
jgi:hypothetical protein